MAKNQVGHVATVFLGASPVNGIDRVVPDIVEGKFFITLIRRDGEQLSGTLEPLAGSLELVRQVMALLWSNNPAAARAILDHLNAVVKPGPQ